MAWTPSDVAALKEAIASGHKEVRYGDRWVSYQSTVDMLSALQRIEAEVAAASGGIRRPATRRFTFTTLRGD